MQTQRYERLLCFGLPAAVLLVAYAAICVRTGTPWPMMHVVHEDGWHTLLGTIFYFEHAARELPLDVLLGLAVAGSARSFYPPIVGNPANSGRSAQLGFFTLGTLAVIGVILGGTLLTVGARGLLDNLAQMHTRQGAPLAWGAHWRYHLLERLATMCLAFAVVGFHRTLAGHALPVRLRSRPLFAVALGLFAALTLLFRPTWEPIREVTFLGHQARELFTHTLVTLPLAIGTALWLARRFSERDSGESPSRLSWTIWVAAAACIMLGSFLAVGSVVTGARDAGLTKSLADLIFPHFFEHSFSYLLVPLTAGLFYLWPGGENQSAGRSAA